MKKIFRLWWADFNSHPNLMVGALVAGIVLAVIILIISGDIGKMP